MPDYLQPTVVQQTIPSADMTPLENLFLSKIFDAEQDGDGLYFYAENSTNDYLTFTAGELKVAITASAGITSTLYNAIEQSTPVRDMLASLDDNELAEIQLDDINIGWDGILQDIVARSKTLRFITVVASFTCSKMKPDGFGGAATIITADDVDSFSTSCFITEKTAKFDEAPAAEA